MVDLKKIIRKGTLPVVVGATLVAGPIGCGKKEVRDDFEFRTDAIACAMNYTGDSVLTNYEIGDSIFYGNGDRIYTIIHPKGFPTQKMTIYVPKYKREKAVNSHAE